MKKNNISIDFIAFGDLESDTKSKLEAFNENVKGGDGSHLIVVPPGPHLLSDVLINSSILAGEGAAGGAGGSGGENGVPGGEGGAGGAGAGASGFEFGIDPSVDPELAMALRMSMEEETHRLDRQRRETEEAEKKDKEEKERLEGIPEEGQAPSQQPPGQESESGGGAEASASTTAEGGEKQEKEDQKDGEGGSGGASGTGGGATDADKMDTA
jgi:26S proteasome regulatory subunit N10